MMHARDTHLTSSGATDDPLTRDDQVDRAMQAYARKMGSTERYESVVVSRARLMAAARQIERVLAAAIDPIANTDPCELEQEACRLADMLIFEGVTDAAINLSNIATAVRQSRGPQKRRPTARRRPGRRGARR